LVYNEPIPAFLQKTCTAYLFNKVLGYLQPVWLNKKYPSLLIENNKLYLLVLLSNETNAEYLVVVNIPADLLGRFYYTEDSNSGSRFVIFLDDIIKENLGKIFAGYHVKASYSFKITRDAALDLQDEYEGDIADKIEKQLKKRDYGLATRFLYQPGIPLRILYAVVEKLNLSNANALAGGNYHNLKDLSTIPIPDKERFSDERWEPVTRKDLVMEHSIFDAIAQNDIIIHTPYQSYDPITRFFNEASIDKTVEEISITIYRVANDSVIINSIISAAKNGKKVTVFVELKARFDEANNLMWAAKMKEAGVKVIYSIPGLKVHAKVALIKRKENNRVKYYGLFSTGNFNENTSCLYTDHILLTVHPGMVRELELLFIFFNFRNNPKKYKELSFDHLLVAQFNLQIKFLQLIDQEIAIAKLGKAASITIKLNSLEDTVLITKLYEASNAGVHIKLIVRSICCLIPGVANMSENISVIRIVDRYLEHGRIFIFNNNDNPLVFMGSADWMKKSMYYRIEVCFPVYDKGIIEEIIKLIEIQLSDNVKAVEINAQMQNVWVKVDEGKPVVRSQKTIYDTLST
jgi:polyphosphate kinase